MIRVWCCRYRSLVSCISVETFFFPESPTGQEAVADMREPLFVASFNEKLLLSNGLSISPLKGQKGQQPGQSDARSLREIVLAINSESDLNDFLSASHSKMPPRAGEPRYERHPVRVVPPIPFDSVQFNLEFSVSLHPWLES